MRKVRAFCGFEQSGKDYSCKRLLMTKGYKKVAFADALKDVAFATLGIDPAWGLEHYEELKRKELFNGLTFRNILEHLGTEGIRKYDRDFWAKAVLKTIKECPNNVCISDLRYANEYMVVRDYCETNGIDFKLVFCDYHSEGYKDDNPHESAMLARFLKDLGYTDQQYVDNNDMEEYMLIERARNNG